MFAREVAEAGERVKSLVVVGGWCLTAGERLEASGGQFIFPPLASDFEMENSVEAPAHVAVTSQRLLCKHLPVNEALSGSAARF